MSNHSATKSYRVFLRDKLDHIQKVVELDCDGDEDGLAKARQIRGASVVELWQGTRMICRLDGEGGELPLFDR